MASAPFELVWKIYYYIDIIDNATNRAVEPSYFSFGEDDISDYFLVYGDNTTSVARYIDSHRYQLRLFNSGTTTGDTMMYLPWMTSSERNNLQRNNYAATGETIIATSVSAEGYFTTNSLNVHEDEAPTMVWSCYYTAVNDEELKDNEIEIKVPDAKSMGINKYPKVKFCFVNSSNEPITRVEYSYTYDDINGTPIYVTGNTLITSFLLNVPGNVSNLTASRRGFQTKVIPAISYFHPGQTIFTIDPIYYITLLSDGEIASNIVLDNLFSTNLTNTLPENKNYSINQQPQEFVNCDFAYSSLAEQNHDLTLRVSDYLQNDYNNPVNDLINDLYNNFSNVETIDGYYWSGFGMTDIMFWPIKSAYTPGGTAWTLSHGTQQTLGPLPANVPQGAVVSNHTNYDNYTTPRYYMVSPQLPSSIGRFYRSTWEDNYGIDIKTKNLTVSGTILSLSALNISAIGVITPTINISISGCMGSNFHSNMFFTGTADLSIIDETIGNQISSISYNIPNQISGTCTLGDFNTYNFSTENHNCISLQILSANTNMAHTYNVCLSINISTTIVNGMCCCYCNNYQNPNQYGALPGVSRYVNEGRITCGYTQVFAEVSQPQVIVGYN